MNERNPLAPRICVDVLIGLACLAITHWLLPPLEAWVGVDYSSPGIATYGLVALAWAPILIVLMILFDLYDLPKHAPPLRTLRLILQVFVMTGFGYLAVSLLTPSELMLAASRKAIVVSGVLTLTGLWMVRGLAPGFYGRPWKTRRALLIGSHAFAIRALRRYAQEQPDELEILGSVDDFKGGPFFERLRIPYLGRKEDLAAVVQDRKPDTLIIVGDQSEYSDAILRLLETTSAIQEIYVRTQIPLFMASDIDILFVQEVPLLKLYSRESGRGTYAGRDLLDRFVALIALVMTLPAFLIVPLLIRLDSAGPIFYRQRRLGRDNAPFSIVKFRSMVADAEKRSGAVLAQRGDPRITRLGRILRATRLDEIPQLWNVLCGDMSIVGPRPERPEFQNFYLETIPWYPLRSRCKPGVTGLAQVAGDYHTSTQRKLLYDVSYLANISPLLDLRILLATVITVLTKRGH